MRVLPEVVAAAPSLSGMALLDFGGKTKSVDLRGIEVTPQDAVTPIHEYVKDGHLRDLDANSDGIVLGAGIAQDLGLRVGDTVHADAPGGKPLDLKVVAVFEAEVPPVDKSRGYTTLRTAQALLGKPDIINRIEVRLGNPDDAVRINDALEQMFGYDGESWRE